MGPLELAKFEAWLDRYVAGLPHRVIPSGSGLRTSAIADPITNDSRVHETTAGDHQEATNLLQVEVDCANMSATSLRDKYRPTYNCWSNMKARAKSEGHPVHPDFQRFVDFLRCTGPRPGARYSIDRIDPTDPEYAPSKVRWLDKAGQANNRTSTIFLTVNGETKPLSVWAAETGQKPDTLRARLRNNLSPEAVVSGASSRLQSCNVWEYRPWAGGPHQADIERLYQKDGTRSELAIDFASRNINKYMIKLDYYLASNLAPEVDDETVERYRGHLRILNKFNRDLEELGRLKKIWLDLRGRGMPKGWSGPRRFRNAEKRSFEDF